MKIPSFRKLLANRRGISMAEVVVSLTMIAMISAAAISVVIASIQFETKYLEEVTALRNCESIAACVRYADDQQEPKDALNAQLKTLGFGDQTPVWDDGKSVWTYTLVKDNCIYILNVNFDTNKYDISAENQNGDVIY